MSTGAARPAVVIRSGPRQGGARGECDDGKPLLRGSRTEPAQLRVEYPEASRETDPESRHHSAISIAPVTSGLEGCAVRVTPLSPGCHARKRCQFDGCRAKWTARREGEMVRRFRDRPAL